MSHIYVSTLLYIAISYKQIVLLGHGHKLCSTILINVIIAKCHIQITI